MESAIVIKSSKIRSQCGDVLSQSKSLVEYLASEGLQNGMSIQLTEALSKFEPLQKKEKRKKEFVERSTIKLIEAPVSSI